MKDSKIKPISVINDLQTVEYNGKIYSFNSTIGLIFLLEDTREISFEIGTWFSKMMTIEKGCNLIEKFTSINSFIEEWEDCKGYIPNIQRQIVVID